VTQYAYPTSDVNNSGAWTTEPLYNKIDEEPYSDSDLVQSPQSAADKAFTVGLGSLTDPGVHTGHTVRIRALVGTSGTFKFELLQTSTVIHDSGALSLTTSFAEYSFTLTAGEAANITDYAALRVRVTAVTTYATKYQQVSWVRLEVPDVAAIDLVPAEGYQTQASDSPVLTQEHNLVVAEGVQVQVSDSPVLSTFIRGAISFADLLLLPEARRLVIGEHKPAIEVESRTWMLDIFALANWSRRKRIDIQTTYLDANLTNFPLYVKIDADTDIGAKCRADGFDIRFTAADGVTLLPYERESWSGGGGPAVTADFWIKTNLATAGTYIWCYYDNPAAADGADPENVWDADFKAVYHMNDATTSTILDSTANDNDGAKTAANEPIEAVGKIGKGQDFISDDKIGLGSDPSLDIARTMEAWFNADSWDFAPDHANPLVEHYDWGGHNGWVLGSRDPYGDDFGIWLCSRTLMPGDESRVAGISESGISTGAWHHAVGVIDGNTARFYLDGIQVATVDITGWSLADVSALNASMGNLDVGNPGYSDFDGKIDEVRISDIARTAAWFKFEYRNQSEADNELTWGEEQYAGTYCYYTPMTDGEIIEVQENGVAYTEKFSAAECDATASTFFMDIVNQRLYLHTSNGDIPSHQTAGVYDFCILAYFIIGFADRVDADGRDPVFEPEIETLLDGGFEDWTSETVPAKWTEA